MTLNAGSIPKARNLTSGAPAGLGCRIWASMPNAWNILEGGWRRSLVGLLSEERMDHWFDPFSGDVMQILILHTTLFTLKREDGHSPAHPIYCTAMNLLTHQRSRHILIPMRNYPTTTRNSVHIILVNTQDCFLTVNRYFVTTDASFPCANYFFRKTNNRAMYIYVSFPQTEQAIIFYLLVISCHVSKKILFLEYVTS